MRRDSRVLLIAMLPLSLMLGGCGTFWDGANNVSDRFQDALHDFNPFGTAKKPLPGERRAVFPEGIPGVQQGVPSELMRGNQQQAEEVAAEPAPPPPAAQPKTKRAAKTRPQARAQAPADASSDPREDAVWPPPPTR